MTDNKKIGGGKLTEDSPALQKWLAGEVQGPLAVEVSATGGCNHGCHHCGYQQFNPYAEVKSFIDLETYKAFLDDFSAMGGQEVFYAGRGEPLLNPHIPELCRYGHELGLSNVMSSNGVPLGARKMAEMMQYMNWVRFSVNGGDPETYGTVHKCSPKDFEKLERNLSAASEHKQKMGLDVQLIMQFIIYDLNYKSLEGAIALHKRVGTDRLVFRNVIEHNGQNRPLIEEIRDMLSAIPEDPTVDIRWETFDVVTVGPAWTKCHGINFRCNLDENGNVYTCTRNNIKKSEIGNIADQRFRDIWTSERKKAVFAEIEPGDDIPMCGRWCDVSKDNVFLENFLKQREEEDKQIQAAQ